MNQQANPQQIIAFMDSVRAETLSRFQPLTQAQLDWRPPGLDDDHHHWSLGETFHHIALDEDYLREHLARPLLEGIKPPDSILYLPPPPQYGLPGDAIQFWFDRARLLTRRMLETWDPNYNLQLTHNGGFEKASNGAEWLMGFAGHEQYHHRQLDELIARVRAL
jgi:hypothetical protein